MISSYRKIGFTSENTSSVIADRGRRRHGHDNRWEEETQQKTKGGGGGVLEKPSDHIPRTYQEGVDMRR